MTTKVMQRLYRCSICGRKLKPERWVLLTAHGLALLPAR